MPGYVAVWCAILLSGLGVAMFHPAAGKAARQDAGDSASAMSPFAALTGIEMLRSVAFFGLNTFIELYWIRHLHASRGLAGVALTAFLAGGVAGTLLGGRTANRIGAVRTVQLGTAVTLPRSPGCC